jgi:hypothetical protein
MNGPDDLFEIGLVVPNLEKAIEQFHHAFGYTFSPIVEGVLPNRDSAGDHQTPMRMAVSRENPQIELFETTPGTCMLPPAGTGLHHLGYYVDDLTGESERLGSLGFPFARAGFTDASHPAGWAYHHMPDGTIVELVDRATAPLRQSLVAGAVPDSPMVHRVIQLSDALAGRMRQ